MNDMMPTIEETATAADLAQIEHQEWERGNEERERWESTEAAHGPLLTKTDLEGYRRDMEEIYAKSLALEVAIENAYKCDDDDDDDDEDWFSDGRCK